MRTLGKSSDRATTGPGWIIPHLNLWAGTFSEEMLALQWLMTAYFGWLELFAFPVMSLRAVRAAAGIRTPGR